MGIIRKIFAFLVAAVLIIICIVWVHTLQDFLAGTMTFEIYLNKFAWFGGPFAFVAFINMLLSYDYSDSSFFAGVLSIFLAYLFGTLFPPILALYLIYKSFRMAFRR